jgi:hypothetical protein
MSTDVRAHQAQGSVWRNSFFGRKLPLETETALFILVSALDVFMTCILLSHQTADGQHFYESNPIANYFFMQWGMKGMVFFKFAMVSFVMVIVQLIAMERLKTAQRLCSFATALSCVVVIYSLSLFLTHTNYVTGLI